MVKWYLAVYIFCAGVYPSRAADNWGWREFSSRVQVLADNATAVASTPAYERHVTKRDVFIFQKSVVVNEPLRSNGGDVLIVADELVLNAPIDTRVYLTLKIDPRFRRPQYWQIGSPKEWDDGVVSLFWGFESAQQALSAFDALHVWYERYNSELLMYQYQAWDAKGWDPRTSSNTLEVAQLPSSLVPLGNMWAIPIGRGSFAPAATNGTNAPSDVVIRDSVRSGTIRIFANKIRLCDKCKEALSKTGQVTDGDPYDFNQAVFFQTSGLKGGRGSAGSPFPCRFTTQARERNAACRNYLSSPGGLSGGPGKGGDAGSVEIFFVNNEDEGDGELLKAITRTQGGQPAQASLKRTPSLLQLEANPTRSAFANEVAVPLDGSLRGEDGKLAIQRGVSSDEAVGRVASILSRYDLKNYSIESLLEKSSADESLTSLLPSDIFRYLLDAELADLQQQLLIRLVPTIRGEISIISTPPWFATLSCDPAAYYILQPLYRDYISRICEFRIAQRLDGVKSYFYRIGGVIRPRPGDPIGEVRHDEIKNELSEGAKLLSQLLDEAKTARLTVFDRLSQERKASFLKAIEQLKQQRDDFEASLASSKSPDVIHFYKEKIANLIKIGERLSAAYAAVAAEKWSSAGDNLAGAINEFVDLTAGKKPPKSAPVDLAELDRSIQTAQANMASGMEAIRQARISIVEEKSENLKSLIRLRGRIANRRADARFRYASLLRVALQDYLQTPSDAEKRLESQLLRIGKSMHVDSGTSPLLDPQPIIDACTKDSPTPVAKVTGLLGCVQLSGEKGPYVISKKGARLDGFPLIAVNQEEQTYAVSFGYLFRRDEIELTLIPN
ncbi:hypothetical protein JQ607_22120 [Bradyrhizobium liaoningense]|uniref:hypothetical protein n=1 Tax=Bradyrhizobium liaoningense TaxID=43992 RepID=UPI001BA9FC89|nr:hypothetical protein [Bradyrhizobium liaoningense]MBR0842907.1 hypothetical protein [Bradyrhizobium liaoningense]